jgi:hypothetical protein
MNDTRPEAAAILLKLFKGKSGEERIKIASSMFDTAKKLVLDSLPKHLSKKEIRQQLFLRFYINDFTGKQITNILNSFREE